MRLFVVDDAAKIQKSYDDLLHDINVKRFEFFNEIQPSNIYETFLNLIISILFEKEVGFALKEEPSEKTTNYSIIENTYKFSDIDSVIEKVMQAQQWKLILHTSGTTGIPKKVSHSFHSITKNIKISAQRSEDVWALAFNPRHMAGLQVFFQAFLNKNTLVNCFGLPKESIFKSIDKYNISHFSATPTFYKLLLPCSEKFESVKQITFGGEKFSDTLKVQLEKIFPSAKFNNIYASTEAGSLFSSYGNYFSVPENIEQFVKIINNELWIHKNLLANTNDFTLYDAWYPTGDIVSVISENPVTFTFISRKNEMINVGGNKVNPHEVEEVILQIPGINDVKVFGKSNSLMGNVLCAEIVSNGISEKEIKSFVKLQLPEYKVPRIIKFVSNIHQTETGKKSRR